jgi:Zn-dependent protease with chaperone function
LIFDVRGLLVSLGFFGVLYCLLSVLVVCVWRSTNLFRRMSARTFAHLLFGLRIFPLVSSALVTLTFALPAFLLFESGVIDEDLGTALFSVCSLLLVTAGIFRAVTAQARTTRVVSEWMDGASILDAGVAVPTFRLKPGVPALLLSGVSQPKVLVSEETVALLSRDELRVSVQHEVEHMRSRDNLKKFVIHCCPFPGMSGLESAWQQESELAADDAAISSRLEAMDLAAALIKLSELAPVQAAPAFTTGLTDGSVSVHLRVERMLAWNEAQVRSARLPWSRFSPLMLAVVFCVAANYSHALSLTHRLTEWFVH